MTGYNIINLAELLKLEEEKDKQAENAINAIKEAISAFSCPLNIDVENFLKHKAIVFAEQAIAATYLVFTSYKEEPVLVGYFTLASKILFIPSKKIESNTLRKRIAKFGRYDEDLKGYQIAIPLIAQLGKNFLNGYNELISGDELLMLACDKIRQIQIMLSGRMTYVECEDKEKLIQFYRENGFYRIADRPLSRAERQEEGVEYLVQLIKYIN